MRTHIHPVTVPTPPLRPARRALLRQLAAAALAGAGGLAQAQDGATVAAASDLKFALEELAARFRAEGGSPPRLVFGSSGTFCSQILQGAPFHLFLSADEDFVFRLADAGKTADRGRLYASGRLVMVVAKGSPVRADAELKDLAAALADGRLRKFAIASPEHAPYGQRAQEALTHAGLWPRIVPRLVYGENVSQAAQFAASGATQGGIVAYSLVMAPQIAGQIDHALIPASWHRPLAQRMVLMRDAPPAARAFYDYLSSPAAQAVLARYGFALPGDK